MVEFVDVTKIFSRKSAVSSISFHIKTGEIVGFVGPNGAGKTTTLRLISGYLRPTSGSISIFGNNPEKKRVAIASLIGYLPENNPLPVDMKVKEYLDFIAQVKHENNLSSILKELHITDVENKQIELLSRGYKQRVGLAGALCGNPSILLLDEPTSGLDPIEQDVIKELIVKLSKKRIVIFSTHILSEIEDIATRLLIINKGALLFDGKKPQGKGTVEKLFKKLVKK